MDFLLTEKGDLLLEEVESKAQPVTLSFFIESQNQAICLKFDIAERFIPVSQKGLLLNFSIKRHETMYKANTVEGLAMIKQMCYNAIRTQKDSLSHAVEYGSYFYKHKNKKITSDLLKQLELIAKDAIKDFAPEAEVEVSILPTNNGCGTVRFDIQLYRYMLTLDYLI